MKKNNLFKVLPLVAVALLGMAIATSCKKEKKNEQEETYKTISLNSYIKGTWVLDPSYISIGMVQDTLVFNNGYFKTNCDIPPYSRYYRTFENDSVVIYGNDTVYLGCPIERLSLDTLRIYNYRPCNLYIEIVMNCLFYRIN